MAAGRALPLPAGLTLGADGALEGTANGPANEIVTFRVTDAAGGVATRALRVRMQHPPLAITAASLGRAAPGHAFETSLASTGGKWPIRWEASNQPAGVSISGTRLRGTPQLDPARFGSVMVTLTATDSDDPPQRTTADVPLAFVPALSVQQIAVASPGAVLGRARSLPIRRTRTGGPV